MSDKTRIEWADATWNPMTGCTPISEACEHCYAERMSGRTLAATRCPDCKGAGGELWVNNFRDTPAQIIGCRACHGTGNVGFTPTFHPDRLDVPLHWRKPRRIFVCSMSDLFHEAFTDDQVREVFWTMQRSAWHTYMVLTKRPERMRAFLDEAPVLPNLWLGVTAENQARADERIPILLDTPAAVRFVSVEPMLGFVQQHSNVKHSGWLWSWLDWVICGGETGPGARPMQPEWALDVYRQCKAAGTAFWFKDWGDAIKRHPKASDLLPAGTWDEAIEMESTHELPEVTS